MNPECDDSDGVRKNTGGEGDGGTTLDAYGSTRIIFWDTVDANQNLTLYDMKLYDGEMPYDGGAVWASAGSLTVDHVTFDGNIAAGQGGAINWDEFYNVLRGNGPCNRDRLRTRVKAWDDGAWFREAMVAHADKPERAAAWALPCAVSRRRSSCVRSGSGEARLAGLAEHVHHHLVRLLHARAVDAVHHLQSMRRRRLPAGRVRQRLEQAV